MDTLRGAVIGNHMNVIKWGYHRANPDKHGKATLCETAVYYNRLSMVKLMRSNRTKGLRSKYEFITYSNICLFAARHNKNEIFDWGSEKCETYPTKICKYAVKHGNLRILKIAIKNGCEWSMAPTRPLDSPTRPCIEETTMEVKDWCFERGFH